MKFHVTRGTTHSVCITVETHAGKLQFWSEGQLPPIASEALREQINSAMHDQVKAIRQHAYEQGRKDARKRAAKKTYFYGCINGDPKLVGC